MSQINDVAAREMELERVQISVIGDLFDERLAGAREQLASVLAASSDGAGAAYERDLAAGRLTGEIRRLEGAEDGLVFGRIDLADGTVLRIGRLGLHRDADELPVLVDWRAEAARPFYEATPIHPMRLRRRRHLRLAGRAVVGVSDELLDGSAPTAQDVIGDGPLTAALQEKRTGRMGAAVATLQTEQDAIVRSPHRGVTVVQGGPGTGKTVVALHRAAYVLYAFPKAAERGVLVVGPNARFLDYICQVLPSLGENDVVLATCEELAGVAPGAADPYEVARLKGVPNWPTRWPRWSAHGRPRTATSRPGSGRSGSGCRTRTSHWRGRRHRPAVSRTTGRVSCSRSCWSTPSSASSPAAAPRRSKTSTPRSRN